MTKTFLKKIKRQNQMFKLYASPFANTLNKIYNPTNNAQNLTRFSPPVSNRRGK